MRATAWRCGSGWLAIALTIGAWAGTAGAAPINVLTDGFGDGDRDNDATLDGPVENAADVGAAFYTARASTNIAVSVASDTAAAGAPVEIGTGNAMKVLTSTTSNRPIVANFASQTLADGDSISLTFDVRVTKDPIDVQDRKFRFGLYNTGGTLVTNNSSAAVTTDDDLGYFAEFDTGPAATTVADVRGDNIPVTPGDNSFLGGTGTHGVSLSSTNAAFSLDDNDAHRMVLTLTRAGAELNIELRFDGAVVDTGSTGGSNPAALTFTYDEIAIGTNGVALDYLIDNVSVDFQPVPEPAGLALIGLAACALLSRGRGRR
jgi:hypothetical protein